MGAHGLLCQSWAYYELVVGRNDLWYDTDTT